MPLLLLLACTSRTGLDLEPAVKLAPAARHAPGGFRAGAGGVTGSTANGRLHARFDSGGGVTLGDDLVIQTTAFGRENASRPVDLSAPRIGDCDGESCVRIDAPGLT